MKAADFLDAHRRDLASLASGISPVGVTTCGKCSVPLQEAITGNRKICDVPADGSSDHPVDMHVCSDCYFEAFGAFLDHNPISAYRPGRRG